MINRFFRVSFVLIFLVLWSQSACTSKNATQTPPPPVELKAVVLPFLTNAPAFIAQAQGYFTQQGLRVEFVNMSRSTEAIPALAQGQLDVVVGAATSASLLNAVARGAKIKIVAANRYVDPNACTSTALMARRTLVDGGALANPAGLKGKKIAASLASVDEYFVERTLNSVGLTSKDVELVDISNAVRLEAIGTGAIDLAVAGEPWLTRMLTAGSSVAWMPVEKMLPDLQYDFVLYGPGLLDQNPDAGKRFMAAYLMGTRDYDQGKTERNLTILSKATDLDRGILEQSCWPTLRRDGQIYFTSLADFQSWAVKKGLVDIPLRQEQIWDARFAQYANQVVNPIGP